MRSSYSVKFIRWSSTTIYLLALSAIGCKKFVQIGPPNTQLVTTSVFSNNGTATAALTAIYTQMYSNEESWAIAQNQGLLSDELTSYSTDVSQEQLYTNSLTAISGLGDWTNAYSYIYQANAVIAALQGNKNITPIVGQELAGEAKFIRAFWHFYLTNEYGDVPLVTTTDYTKNKSIYRTPQAQVYQQIVADLLDAENLLNTNYVDETDTTSTKERVRPNKATAQAFLARVYLYTEKFDSAETQATTVINNTGLYRLCTSLSGSNSVFLANSSEAIWQLSTPLPANYNTADGEFFILSGAPSTGTGNSISVSSQLLNSFESGDQRKQDWLGVYTGTGSPVVQYYFPYKYQSYNTSSPITEYTMVLRLAEQFLIRAEARAQQGDLAGATADLNAIRVRAGLPLYSGGTDQASLLSAILHERQVELFTEWGQRWFDLKRLRAIDSVMGSPGGVCQSKGGVWNSNSALYPIPETEILNDPNLGQNQGY
jgi:starch-binding outer membrane protein, SusD/RagB family